MIKNLFLGAATLILVETTAVTPAQAFTLTFQSIDRTVTGNIVGPDSGVGTATLSLTGQGLSFSGASTWLPGVPSGNIGFVRMQTFLGATFLGYLGGSPPPSGVNLPPQTVTRSQVSLNLLCQSQSNCSGGYGSIGWNSAYSSPLYPAGLGTNPFYNWTGYNGQIEVTAWNPTAISIPITPPTSGSTSIPTATESSHSVPEPSPVNALLLLGSGWLLCRKLGLLTRGWRRDRACP